MAKGFQNGETPPWMDRIEASEKDYKKVGSMDMFCVEENEMFPLASRAGVVTGISTNTNMSISLWSLLFCWDSLPAAFPG